MSYQDQDYYGRETIPCLAGIYEQIYLPPGPVGEKYYKEVALEGSPVPCKDLSHYQTSEKDSSVFTQTPAGKVRVVTLGERADFETLLRAMGMKGTCAPIPPTQGASILDGVVNQKKIADYKSHFYEEHPDASFHDWYLAFEEFKRKRENYQEAFILLSMGPYSAVPASALNLSPQVWLEYSLTIRKYHECTHFLCRRMFPEQISAIWDELVADTVGIVAASGRFDQEIANTCLGISQGQYKGGRLINYVKDPTPEKMNALARSILEIFQVFEETARDHSPEEPFQLAIALEHLQAELTERYLSPSLS